MLNITSVDKLVIKRVEDRIRVTCQFAPDNLAKNPEAPLSFEISPSKIIREGEPSAVEVSVNL